VVTDPELDIAVLRAHAALQVMPWKIGRSADLRERNVVEVRGFPLGAFRATNIGKVISAHDHDDFGDWDHDDFVVDALLSAGNSGSPVLAVSRATGEYELVGVFHAGYSQGSALNVVVGIDQVRDLMTTLKRSPHGHQDDPLVLDGANEKLQSALGPLKEMFFPFGGQVASIRARPDGTLLFVLFGKDFPLASDPLLVIEHDGTGVSTFGAPGRVWVGSPHGLNDYAWSALAPEIQPQVTRILDAMATDGIAYASLRDAREGGSQSRQSSDRLIRLGKAFARTTASRADLIQSIGELGEKLAPSSGSDAVHFAQLLGLRPPSAVRPAAQLNGPIGAVAQEAGRMPSPSAQQ
jgi:hypothetical protein